MLNDYRFKLHHDKGNIKIKVIATDEPSARNMVKAMEYCPDNAIELLKVTEHKV